MQDDNTKEGSSEPVAVGTLTAEAFDLAVSTGVSIATTAELVQNNDEVSSPLMVSERYITPKLIAELRDKAKLYDELVVRLHSIFAHPDYEYTTTSFSDAAISGVMPTGNGWVKNLHAPGHNRLCDGLVFHCWMRTKEDAELDDINPYSLPPVTLDPIDCEALFSLFIEKSTVPDRTTPREALPAIISGSYEEHEVKSGYYRHGNDQRLYLFMTIPGLEILMDLDTQMAHARVPKLGCVWHNWYGPLNVNTVHLSEAFDFYA